MTKKFDEILAKYVEKDNTIYLTEDAVGMLKSFFKGVAETTGVKGTLSTGKDLLRGYKLDESRIGKEGFTIEIKDMTKANKFLSLINPSVNNAKIELAKLAPPTNSFKYLTGQSHTDVIRNDLLGGDLMFLDQVADTTPGVLTLSGKDINKNIISFRLEEFIREQTKFPIVIFNLQELITPLLDYPQYSKIGQEKSRHNIVLPKYPTPPAEDLNKAVYDVIKPAKNECELHIGNARESVFGKAVGTGIKDLFKLGVQGATYKAP